MKHINDGTIYQAIIGYCEELEHKGAYTGNGHHLAQKLAKMVTEQPDIAKAIERHNAEDTGNKGAKGKG